MDGRLYDKFDRHSSFQVTVTPLVWYLVIRQSPWRRSLGWINELGFSLGKEWKKEDKRRQIVFLSALANMGGLRAMIKKKEDENLNRIMKGEKNGRAGGSAEMLMKRITESQTRLIRPLICIAD